MRVSTIRPAGAGVILAVMEGALDRTARRDSYRSIARAVELAQCKRLVIDKSQLPGPGAFDIDFGDWDHDEIAETLHAAGIRNLAVVDAGRDDLSGYLVMALRRAGIAVLTASDVDSALIWLRSEDHRAR